MVSRGNVLFYSHDFAKFSRELGCKAGVSIADDFARESEVDKYVFDVQCCRAFGVDLFIAGYKDCRFSAIVIGDSED